MAITGEHPAVRALALAAVTLAAFISPARAVPARASAAFVPSVTVATDANPEVIAVSDVNGDGKADLAVGNSTSGTVGILLGENSGRLIGAPSVGGTTTPPATRIGASMATLPALPLPTATLPALPPPTSTPASRRATTLTPTSISGGRGGPGPRPATTPTSSAASAVPRATPTPASTAYPSASMERAGSPTLPAANASGLPSITLSPSTARPGISVTVNGRDFGPGQLITLALDGESLATRPAVIVSDRQGRFTAAFVAPRSLLPGQNTVAASAAPGGRTTVAPLASAPGVSSQFYFAAGEDSATVHASLTLLNSDRRPAQVHLTFYGRTGVTTARSVTVGATRERTLSVAGLHVGLGSFGLAVRSDRAIAATLSLSRVGRDGDILLGSPDLATHWYLAEGYTSLTFHESVAILNPAGAVARVTLHLLPVGGRHARAVVLRVAPHSETIADVNRLLPRQALSVSTDSDRPVVVARTLTFSSDRAGTGFGLTLRTGSTTPATTWLFAEGNTLDRFQTFLTVLNPNRAPARVTAQFYGDSGRALGRRALIVAAQSRGTLKLNTFLKARGIASVVLSDRPVLVERAEYFGVPNSPSIAGADVFGRNGPAVRWSFPGGPGAGLSEVLPLYNPSAVTVPIDATFYGRNGETRLFHFILPPHAHDTVVVRRVSANFAPERGITLRATNGRGFVAEQTLFAPDHRTLMSTQGFAQ